MNRFQDPIQSIDVTLSPLHPDYDFFPFGNIGPLHFWYKRGKNPIKGFTVAPEAQGAPGGGYERIRVNIQDPESPAQILWCKRGGAESPVVDLRLAPNDAPPAEGFECTKEPLQDNVHVWFKTQNVSRELRDWDKIFYEGARFDVKDGRVWRPATVIALNDANIRVSFDGWSKKWDETFAKTDHRIAPLFSVSKGNWKGPSQTLRPAYPLVKVWDDFQASMADVARCILKLSDNKALSEDEVDLLLFGRHFWYLRKALHCDLGVEHAVEYSEDVQKYIQIYLQLVLVVLSHQNCSVQPHWFNVAVLALGGDVRNCGLFYANFGFHKAKVQGHFATSSTISPYLAENIDFFGSHKGFDYVARRLNPEAKTSFTISSSLLQFIQSVMPNLSQAFTAQLLEKLDLQHVFRGMIRNITEAELRRYEQPVIMDKVKRMASALMDRGAGEEDIGMFLEECEMELLNAVIRLGVFKQKMQAMEHLGKVIESVVPPQFKRYLTGEDRASAAAVQTRGSYQSVQDSYGMYRRRWVPDPLPPQPSAKHLTMEWLVEWILEHRIVERMLGGDSHEQLIRRTAPVLKFLAQQKNVTREHIQLLWDAHAGAGESAIRIVQETLADLAQALPREHLDFLFSRIKQKSLLKYKDYDMLFLKQFTISALKSPESVLSKALDEEEADLEEGKDNLQGVAEQLQKLSLQDDEDDYFGLDLFWQMLLLPELRLELRNQAFGILKGLLAEPALDSRLPIYTRKCIQVLQEAVDTARPVSMIYVLKLLIHVVAVGDPAAVGQTIQDRDREFDLINLVLQNAVLHSRTTKAETLLRAEAGDLPPEELRAIQEAHTAELTTYMDFVRESIQYSALLLQTPHIQLLSQAMVQEALQAEDTQLFFKELSTAVRKPETYFDAASVESIFQLLASADVSATVRDPGASEDRFLVTLEWYRCFQRFFLHVNSQIGGITSPVRAAFQTKSLERLLGFEDLWRFAAEAADPLVSQAARRFTVLLFLRLDPELPSDQLQAAFQRFVEQSMGILKSAAEDMGPGNQLPPARVQQVGQVVCLIDTFLNQVQQKDSELTVRPLFQKGEQVKAWWRSNRRNILYDAQIIQVNSDGSYDVFYADQDRDSKCPEHNLFNLDGSRRFPKALDPAIRDLPQQLLASGDQYFDLFFQLLGLGGDTAQLVWGLLSTLPTNQTLLVKMQSLTTVPEGTPIEWSEFLPSDSFIKLLYTLGIVRSLIRFPQPDPSGGGGGGGLGGEDSSGDDDDLLLRAEDLSNVNLAWRRMFLQREGFAHLYQAFLDMPDADIVSGPLPKQSVVSVLQILKHFLLDPEEATGVSQAEARAVIDFPRLLQRLLSCFHAVVSNPLPDSAPKQTLRGHVVLLRQCGTFITSLLSQPLPEGTSKDLLSEAVYSFPHWKEILFHGFLQLQAEKVMKETEEQITSFWEELKLRQLGGLPSISSREEGDVSMNDDGGVEEKEDKTEGEAPEEASSEGAAAAVEDIDRVFVGRESPMHSFFLPLVLGFLPEVDPNAVELHIEGLFQAAWHLLGDFQITPEVMDIVPTAECLTNLVRSQAFEEDSNVVDHVLFGLLGLAKNIVSALPIPDRFLFGIGLGSSSPPDPKLGGGGALEDDPDLLNAINATMAAEPLNSANTSTGGTGLVVDLVRYLFAIPRNTSSSTTNQSQQVDLPPKLKAKKTRMAAFDLLKNICHGSARDSLVVVRGLMPNHIVTADNDTFDQAWDYTFREYEVKRRGAYVGLRNLGCICYMNSSLQQLFMIPKLRQNVLAIEQPEPKPEVGSGSAGGGGGGRGEDKHSGVVYQLQHLFANLQESTETYVSPKNLTDIWIGDDGKPIHVGKQEDSADFVNTLIDRINEKLKGTKQENLLTSILRGQIADQIFGRGGCPHYREHTQPFSVLPVEIKGKKTLKEALDGFVDGELMAGDNKVNCEQCGQKQAVYKRQALKQLPQVLCINLKRFALDYTTFETEKINARLEFPMELDMRPYTIDNLAVPEDEVPAEEGKANGEESSASAATGGDDADGEEGQDGQEGEGNRGVAPPAILPDDHYKYVLRGVVIHTGDVNRGHYYSYIQERSKDPKVPGKWYCFNDHSVQSFNPEHLAQLAFGGEKSSSGHANAYLLFYDRVSSSQTLAEDSGEVEAEAEEEKQKQKQQPQPKKKVEVEEPGYEIVHQEPEEGAEEQKLAEEPQQTVASAKVPQDIFRNIWQQNITSARDKLVYDMDYFDFLADFLGQLATDFPAHPAVHPRRVDLRSLDLKVPVDLRDAAARLGARFLIKSLARCTFKRQLNPLGEAIRKLFRKNTTASAWILWLMVVERRWAEDFILEAPWDDIRKNIGHMLTSAVSQVAPLERDLLSEIQENKVPAWPNLEPFEFPEDIRIQDLPHVQKSEADEIFASAWDTEPTPDGKVARRDAFQPPGPKGYAANFFDVLLRILPTMLPKWFWNFDYFRIWASAVCSEEALTAYAVQRGGITHLLDVWLGNESPHQVVEITRDHAGNRLVMAGRQSAVHTNLDSFLIALGAMVELNVRQTGTAWGESEMDRDMLTHPVFLHWLPSEASTYERGLAVCQILLPLVREDRERTDAVIQRMKHLIELLDFDANRPLFRWLPAFLGLSDSLQAERVESTMSNLVETILRVLAHFWKDSDFYIAHLIRLAKVSPEARTWFRAHPQHIQALLDWLQTHPDPSALAQQDQPGQARSHSKPLKRFRARHRTHSMRYRDWFEVNVLTSPYSGPQDMPAEDKIAALQAILVPDEAPGALELDLEGYDSDSESWKEDWEVGDEVDARDSSMNWREARVVNKLGNSIYVKYTADYFEEWVKLRQFRLAPRGTFSKLAPPPVRSYHDRYF